LLICSYLGLSPNPDPVPLTLKDWNALVKKLQATSLRPGDLLGFTSSDLQMQLEMSTEDAEKGGTWAGATEAMKAKWVPVFVLDHPAMSEGNRLLIQKGALKFPHPFPEHPLKLKDWLDAQAAQSKSEPIQPSLF